VLDTNAQNNTPIRYSMGEIAQTSGRPRQADITAKSQNCPGPWD
jgi:hypothetical protein